MNFYGMDSKLINSGSSYSVYTESFVINEGFNDHGYRVGTTGNTIISGQIIPITSIANDYSYKLQTVNKNYYDLSSNIGSLINIRSDISGNAIYDYNTPFTVHKPKTLVDGLIYDNNLLVNQENAMYVLGTITAATLIIFAIVIGRE
jgi:hypothetical protein